MEELFYGVVRKCRRKSGEKDEKRKGKRWENDLGREEIERVLRGLKNGKAAGVDGTVNEL